MKRNKLLYVDDEQENLISFKYLYKKDFDIVLAQSGREALEILREEEFSIIVSDNRMPEMSGAELLEKAAKLYPDTPRILLTGYSDLESIIYAINKGGIFKYVSKPFDTEDLKKILREASDLYHLKRDRIDILGYISKDDKFWSEFLNKVKIIIIAIQKNGYIEYANEFFYKHSELKPYEVEGVLINNLIIQNYLFEDVDQNRYREFTFKRKESNEKVNLLLTQENRVNTQGERDGYWLLGFNSET